MERSAAVADRPRVAMLPRGVDGLFLPEDAAMEVAPLVLRGSPEEAWAETVWGAARLVRYDLYDADLGP